MALERRAVQKHKHMRAMVCKVMQREGGVGGRRRPARAPYTAVSNIHRSNSSVYVLFTARMVFTARMPFSRMKKKNPFIQTA